MVFLFSYFTTYTTQKVPICGEKLDIRASPLPRSARAGYPCWVRVGYPGTRSDYPGKSTAPRYRLWKTPLWSASGVPRSERPTPVREWDTPVARSRRSARPRG